jgi:hypothetical protein
VWIATAVKEEVIDNLEGFVTRLLHWAAVDLVRGRIRSPQAIDWRAVIDPDVAVQDGPCEPAAPLDVEADALAGESLAAIRRALHHSLRPTPRRGRRRCPTSPCWSTPPHPHPTAPSPRAERRRSTRPSGLHSSTRATATASRRPATMAPPWLRSANGAAGFRAGSVPDSGKQPPRPVLTTKELTMAEPLLGYEPLVGHCDPVSRLATVRGWSAGPAGTAGLDLGGGIELDVDIAAPGQLTELVVELPSAGRIGSPTRRQRRSLDALLGPERAEELVALAREASVDGRASPPRP